MIKDFVYVTRSLNYKKKIIVSAINEPLEHMTQKEIHWLNDILSKEIVKYTNVYLAVGEMACDFYSYYKSYLNIKYKYDYISFHSDNRCKISVLTKFLKLFPKDLKLINNEHYYYNGAKEKGYDNIDVLCVFQHYTNYLVCADQVKSIYICMPFHYYYNGKYNFLGLNLVNTNNYSIYETKAWKMLKQYDIKAVIEMYLKEYTNGDKNFQIRGLQSALNKAEESDLKVDGWFGDKTRDILVTFNQKHNISIVDICSYATWYELIQDFQTETIIKDLIDLIKVIE